MYTIIQVERHRALTTKFSKAWGDSGWSPTRWIHLLGPFHFFGREMDEHFSVFLHPNGVSAWTLQEKAQKLFQGLVLGEAKYGPPPHAPLHVHERHGARAFSDRRQPRPQTLMTLYEEGP